MESGPADWSERFHTRLMLLLGHPQGDPPYSPPGAVRDHASARRLLASRKPGGKPLPKGEAEETGGGALAARTAAEA